ncbi:quinoprotein dehydrogenase-associated SoxYZ-like carrier [Pseudorhodoferax sp.]|uniref:quinoprotein dehydrogenase-associated SoxYZ-like carrier n=1 Tax=Pseudorhodoferax sp. TaxID=1993553 RepID=UPI002DD623FB|nr:quinoprotein dehydrogenase-associated SoxYZ-like carrier [Pseudorhodoferax sp.]
MRTLLVLVALCLLLPARAANAVDDPLRSPLWHGMRQRMLGSDPVVFDARVRVALPPSAEDPLAVPVELRFDGLAEVEQVRVFADLNPIPQVLDYWPGRAGGALAFRIKVEQSTPVRAAVRTRDGTWHVGGAWVAATGGGCTMPSQGSGNAAWQERLGEVSARLWPRPEGASRLRLRVVHPMDTGLAGGIPVFHVDRLALRDAAGQELVRLQLHEPVAENPVLSIDLRHPGPVRIEGRDTQGNRIAAEVRP